MLIVSSPEEVKEAHQQLLSQRGVGLDAVVEQGQRYSALDLSSLTLSAQEPSRLRERERLHTEFIHREFDKAAILPPHRRLSRYVPTEEKLEILTEFVVQVRERSEEYPGILERGGRSDIGGQSQLHLFRHFRPYLAGALGEHVSGQDLLSYGGQAIERTEERLGNYQRSLESLRIGTVRDFILDLRTLCFFSVSLAQDAWEDANQRFQEGRSESRFHQLLGIKSLEACGNAFSALYARYLLMKRVQGIQRLVDHLEGAVRQCA